MVSLLVVSILSASLSLDVKLFFLSLSSCLQHRSCFCLPRPIRRPLTLTLISLFSFAQTKLNIHKKAKKSEWVNEQIKLIQLKPRSYLGCSKAYMIPFCIRLLLGQRGRGVMDRASGCGASSPWLDSFWVQGGRKERNKS